MIAPKSFILKIVIMIQKYSLNVVSIRYRMIQNKEKL